MSFDVNFNTKNNPFNIPEIGLISILATMLFWDHLDLQWLDWNQIGSSLKPQFFTKKDAGESKSKRC